jgi:uncharacterized protein
MSQPVELGYFTIPVADLERAQAFYGQLFGWEFGDGHPAYAHVANTKLPFGLVAGAAGDVTNLYFRVDDVAVLAARVRDLGGEADPPLESPSGLTAACRDDGGTAFSLWQPAPGY